MKSIIRRMVTVEQASFTDVWDVAREIVQADMAVLPLLHGEKEPNTRLVPHGVDDASNDWSEVKHWRDVAPEANLGLAIQNFAVADYDPRNDEDGLQKNVMVPLLDGRGGPRQDTPSGGIHFILEAPPHRPGGKWAGADIKTSGYIAVAPSLRNDCEGRRYVWTRGGIPFPAQMPQVPRWLMKPPNDAMRQLGKRLAGDATGLNDTTGSGFLFSIVALAGPALLSQEECRVLVATCPALAAWRKKHAERVIERKFNDALREVWRPVYEPTPEETLAEEAFQELRGRSPLFIEKALKDMGDKLGVSLRGMQAHFRAWQRDNSPVVDVADIYARRVLEKHFAGGAHLVNANGILWRYSPAVPGGKPIFWDPIHADIVRQMIEAEIEDLPKGGDKRKASVIADALRLIRDKRTVPGDVFGLTRTPPMVFNCLNWEVHYDGGKWITREHNPKSYLRHALQVDFDPDAGCPIFERMLDEICAKKSWPVAEGRFGFRHDNNTRAFLEELLAAGLMPRKLHQIIAAIVGHGGNGKTTLIEVLEHLGGPSVRVGAISEVWNSRFALAPLANRSLLVDDDVSAGTMLDTGTLKNLSNPNQKRETEAKGGAHYDIWLNLTIILMGNEWPPANDATHGWTRRSFGLQLTRIFYKPHEVPGLLERFTAPDELTLQREHGCVPAQPGLMKEVVDNELPGVLNLLMRAFARMEQRGTIIRPPRLVVDSKLWNTSADPVGRFVAEQLVEVPSGDKIRIPTTEIYNAFVQWKALHRIRAMVPARGFAERLALVGCRITRPHNVAHVNDRAWRREQPARVTTEAATTSTGNAIVTKPRRKVVLG